MFIYIFINRQFINQLRKVVSNFPLPESFMEEMKKEGWTSIELLEKISED